MRSGCCCVDEGGWHSTPQNILTVELTSSSYLLQLLLAIADEPCTYCNKISVLWPVLSKLAFFFCMGILSYYSFPMLFVVSLSTLSYIDTFFFDCRSLDFLPTKYSSCRSHFFAVLCKVLGLLLRRDVSGFKADFSYSCLWEFVCCFDFILNGEVDRFDFCC